MLLTPLAATGLAVAMAPAPGFHLRRREYSAIGITSVLLALAAVVGLWPLRPARL
ncbi:DoxX family protein [Kitasatospora cheerisanensis]|uniref:Uncharacterized protein n=1 Tax=Kitasatospora cheerisanensis KCTC 2395 TaxID=1348663 RepID=A0A066YSZ4_9ACTN|nr:DoxX family protein [Kitasatospora cheerisanensis]KDN81055.1 hypothetical protein KCH_71490 [Kitasatospora cheerisanensis KCTC 2395]